MFAKIIGPSEFRVNGSRQEELTLLHSYLQMLNDKMLKTNNDTCLKYKYHLKQMTIRKKCYKFRNPKFNILCKIVLFF